MSTLHHSHTNSVGPNTARAPTAPVAQRHASAPAGGRQPLRAGRARMGVAWTVVWTAPVVLTALIVFLLQNTRSVEVSFVGLHGTFPLAMALLIAMVGGIVLTAAFRPARIASHHSLRGRRSTPR